jgi:hypothetical protein
MPDKRCTAAINALIHCEMQDAIAKKPASSSELNLTCLDVAGLSRLLHGACAYDGYPGTGVATSMDGPGAHDFCIPAQRNRSGQHMACVATIGEFRTAEPPQVFQPTFYPDLDAENRERSMRDIMRGSPVGNPGVLIPLNGLMPCRRIMRSCTNST